MLRNLQGENPRLPEGRFLVSLGHALMPHFRRQRGAMPASPLCPGPHWAVCGPDEGRRARDLRGDGVATKRDKQLAKLLPIGDTLLVLKDLADFAHAIETAGANHKVLQQPVDTTTNTRRASLPCLPCSQLARVR